MDVHYCCSELNEPINYQSFIKTPPILLPLTNLLVQITTLRGDGAIWLLSADSLFTFNSLPRRALLRYKRIPSPENCRETSQLMDGLTV